MSYKKIILSVCSEWTPSWKLEKESTPFGWIGSSGTRRCRELAEEGLLETRYVHPYVEYRTTRKGTEKLKPKDRQLFDALYPTFQ